MMQVDETLSMREMIKSHLKDKHSENVLAGGPNTVEENRSMNRSE